VTYFVSPLVYLDPFFSFQFLKDRETNQISTNSTTPKLRRRIRSNSTTERMANSNSLIEREVPLKATDFAVHLGGYVFPEVVEAFDDLAVGAQGVV